ncbi:hypothetical protein GQ600_6235 [Phytophthora cactorum]|nr:hypothetical protein GQ600_6235 [Phytophthora cactorum]
MMNGGQQTDRRTGSADSELCTGQSRGGETTYYCAVYKQKTSPKRSLASRVCLCNKVNHTSNGEATSCFEIRHKL